MIEVFSQTLPDISVETTPCNYCHTTTLG